MIRKILINPLFWIFVLALFLRIYKLSDFPVGFHVDEVKVGWNALSILKTGVDDLGNRFSLYYNSFGDFRPTGIFYLTIPSLLIFGINEFAVRFPSALFGALTIFPIYLLGEMLLPKKRLGIISAFILALSPWHIEVSRATSEVVISTFFALFAIFFLIKLIKTQKNKFVYLTIASILASYLLYHAVRLLAPPFFLAVFFYYFKEIKSSKNYKVVLIPLVFVFALSIFFSITKEARMRFNQVSISSDFDTTYEIDRVRSENRSLNLATRIFDNKYFIYGKHFLMQYGDYFSEDFLAGYSGKPYRYATPGVGLLTYVEMALFLAGVFIVIKGKSSYLPLILLLIAPLPASLTTEDAPNLSRAFLMVPFISLIEAYGFQYLESLNKKVKFILIFLLILNFSFFWYMYFNHSTLHKPFIRNYVLDGSSYRNVGTKELALSIEKIKNNYDKIVITSSPDSIYPWYAFFTGKDPEEFNKYAVQRTKGEWSYQNILFTNQKCPSDNFKAYTEKKLLIIDSGDCAYQAKIKDGLPAKVVDKITRQDGSEVYIYLEKITPE